MRGGQQALTGIYHYPVKSMQGELNAAEVTERGAVGRAARPGRSRARRTRGSGRGCSTSIHPAPRAGAPLPYVPTSRQEPDCSRSLVALVMRTVPAQSSEERERREEHALYEQRRTRQPDLPLELQRGDGELERSR